MFNAPLQELPPRIANPPIGMSVPSGGPCPRCGVIRYFWLYAPFSREVLATGGWHRSRSPRCTCPPEGAA